jgi:hypothetical protein
MEMLNFTEFLLQREILNELPVCDYVELGDDDLF